MNGHATARASEITTAPTRAALSPDSLKPARSQESSHEERRLRQGNGKCPSQRIGSFRPSFWYSVTRMAVATPA